MTKNLKRINTILIPLFLALVCGLFFCLTCYFKSSNSANPEMMRTIEVSQAQINYQSVLNDFDNAKLETEGSLTKFEGSKTLELSDFEGLDNVSESDVESNIGCEVKYNVSYDAETNIVTLSASMENGEVLTIENIYGSAFFDENGTLDAVMSLDGDCILLSEMQNLGMIENCGWFSNLFKKILKVTVIVASVAVCVATAGMAVGAVIAIGAAVSAAESVATQLLETGTVCLATLAIDTAIGAIPGGSGAKAAAKEGVQAFSKKAVKETAEKVVKKKGLGNPVKIEGLGKTGRTIPKNINEQMAMHQIQASPLTNATKLTKVVMNDSRWLAKDGWVKMQNIVTHSDGSKTTIHFVYNESKNLFDDFKFI